MDYQEIITSVVSALGITSAGIWWLGRRWVSHKLNQNLEQAKVNWAGEVQKSVEKYLGDIQVARDYQYEAKKGLYHAIGPLRFQLLLACADLVY